jgi:CubicO group peptidase (beta-lactamase class C family)
MRRHIWEPLGIKDMTFFLSTRPDMQARVAHMTQRIPSDNSTAHEEVLVYAPTQPVLNPDAKDCLGGGGIFTSPRELFKVIHAVLLASRSSASDTAPVPPAQLLRRSTVESMFRPQLGESGREALQRVAQIPRLNRMMGDMPVAAAKDWGLGGLLLMDDLPGWRGSGTMTWGGFPSLTWVSPDLLVGKGAFFCTCTSRLPVLAALSSSSLTDPVNSSGSILKPGCVVFTPGSFCLSAMKNLWN